MTFTEPTFQRCPHDKKNPYVMVSREMAQDPTISPKAKGVLLYLLSLPSDWKIFHSQLQKGLNVGEDYINSAMKELISQGYADRTRVRLKGKYQAYQYVIRESKFVKPVGENQAGFSGPENPDIQSKKPSASTEETATQYSGAANSDKLKIHQCLERIDIPPEDKVQITILYEEPVVKDALLWATDPSNPPRNCLAASIKYACKHKLGKIEKPLTPIEMAKKIFKPYEIYNGAECFINSDGIAFTRNMNHGQLKFDNFFSWPRLRQLCDQFQIDLDKLTRSE